MYDTIFFFERSRFSRYYPSHQRHFRNHSNKLILLSIIFFFYITGAQNSRADLLFVAMNIVKEKHDFLSQNVF